MNAVLAVVIALGVVQAYGAESNDGQAPSLDDQIAYILDHPLAESEYAKSNRCIAMQAYRSVDVLDMRHLLFVGNGGALWLNRLRVDCVGLQKDSVLIFEGHGNGLCDMDGFRGAPRNLGSIGFAARCMLGHFESISDAQADLLREAFARPTRASSR